MLLKFFNTYEQRLLEARIRDRVGKYLLFSDIDLFFFGSRVDGTATEFSDIDIGIFKKDGTRIENFILLQEEILEIDSLVKLELVDFATVSDDFKKIAMKSVLSF